MNGKINKKIRFLIKHEEKLRSIFWIYVTKDGSISLGPGYKNNIMAGSGSKILEKGLTHIDFDEVKYLADKEEIEKVHFTYHASGEIHTGLEKSYGTPLIELKKQMHICSILFEHPYNYPITEHTRKTDYFLKCSVSENAPLQCKIYVAPKNNWQIILDLNLDSQDNGIFCFSKLVDDVPNLIYQIVIGYGFKMRWPPETRIVAIPGKIISDI